MVYKKYIVKNGKLYGPYAYSSKRVGGKVVSEYHGVKVSSGANSSYLKLLTGVVLILGLFLFGLFYFYNNSGFLTGGVIGVLEKSDSVFKISLNSGELLPATSKLIFSDGEITKEYFLSEILNEKQVEGNYYISEKSLNGSGSGYGILGNKLEYPEVNFKLKIISSESDVDERNSDEQILINESSEENFVEEDNNSVEEIVDSENSSEEQEIENFVEEIVEEDSSEQEVENLNEIEKEIFEDDSLDEEVNENNILENVISNFFLLFGAKITGNVVSDSRNEIEEKINFEEEYSFELEEGQNVELIEGSVFVGEEQISDSYIKIEKENNLVKVTTSYFETETGFGEEYVGNEVYEINIDLSSLNLEEFAGKDTFVKLVFDDETILSKSFYLEEKEEIVEEKNISEEVVLENISYVLSQDEINFLISKFGISEVKVSPSVSKNKRIFITFSLGNYWVENSYDVDLSSEGLSSLIEIDKIKFLKDLVRELK